MTDEDAVQVWLVYREYNDKGLFTTEYATPDGERMVRKHLSPVAAGGVTAAVEVEPDRLEPVEDEATRERYAEEVGRMVERHEPDDEV